MRQIAEFVAVLSCSLFTGASVYINLVEHPARMYSHPEQITPHGIAINKPTLTPSDCSCPRPKL